jgi:hypothetical protein
MNIPVVEGELCWLIEQTSTVDGIRRFWNGRSYGVDALKAARYPTREGAEETAGIGHSHRTVISTVHGRPEICEHLFQCGISADIAELRKAKEETERDAQRYLWLREQAGYVEDGSCQEVSFGQDDATRSWSIRCGNRHYYGDHRTLDAAIDEAMKK